MQTTAILKSIALAAVMVGLATRPAAASFTITLDTSSLSGTELVAFGLTNGDLVSNNTIELSDFTFDGGSAVAGTDVCSGLGCSGNLGSSVLLQDLGDQFFYQAFAPGSLLSFRLTTTNDFAGGTPDGFAMYICDDDSFTLCYSDDQNSLALLVLELDGSALTADSFTLTGASDQGIDAPVVTAVPEPATLVLLGMAAAGVVARGRSIRGPKTT